MIWRRHLSVLIWGYLSMLHKFHTFWGFFLHMGEASLIHLWFYFFLRGRMLFYTHWTVSTSSLDHFLLVCILHWGQVTWSIFLFFSLMGGLFLIWSLLLSQIILFYLTLFLEKGFSHVVFPLSLLYERLHCIYILHLHLVHGHPTWPSS